MITDQREHDECLLCVIECTFMLNPPIKPYKAQRPAPHARKWLFIKITSKSKKKNFGSLFSEIHKGQSVVSVGIKGTGLGR